MRWHERSIDSLTALSYTRLPVLSCYLFQSGNIAFICNGVLLFPRKSTSQGECGPACIFAGSTHESFTHYTLVHDRTVIHTNTPHSALFPFPWLGIFVWTRSRYRTSSRRVLGICSRVRVSVPAMSVSQRLHFGSLSLLFFCLFWFSLLQLIILESILLRFRLLCTKYTTRISVREHKGIQARERVPGTRVRYLHASNTVRVMSNRAPGP